MTIRTGQGTALDPITFEVIRNKLSAITEEQATTLKNVSGSPVVTEATDFGPAFIYMTAIAAIGILSYVFLVGKVQRVEG